MNLKNISNIGLGVTSALLSTNANAQNPEKHKQPNVLWVYLEDVSPLMSCYGTSINPTPNIDNLAENGLMFTNLFMPVPVSSPSRSGVITGTMPTKFGLHNHHSSRSEESAIYLPQGVKTVPELFKENGYFTFNNGKDDYNFYYDRAKLYGDQNYYEHPLYGKSGEHIELSGLKDKQPFFGQIQLYGGKEMFSSKFKEKVKHPVDRDKVVLPPYLPKVPAVLEEYANHMDCIQITDSVVGQIIENLRKDSLLGNTIVILFADHGMQLTRHKQFLFDGGTHVPFIITWFNGNSPVKPGSINDDLISGVDISTTSLAMAGIPIPGYMDGKNLFAENYKPREYVISTRDRCDFTIDRIRSVRNKEFRYIKNFLTDRPYLQTSYMDLDSMDYVVAIKKLYAENKLDSIQARFVSSYRPSEELYDINNDPHEIVNLANDPKYAEILIKYREILNNWIKETDDKGQYPESLEGLKFMYGMWGDYCTNPEYDEVKKEFKNYGGSLIEQRKQGWKKVTK